MSASKPERKTVAELRFRDVVRPNDMVVWGQCAGEPLSLTEALMAQRGEIGGFRAGIGLVHSDAADPAHADHVTFVSYIGGAHNRRLAKAGKLEIVPEPYSRWADALSPVDVLLLHLAPAGPDGRHSMGLAQEYIADLIGRARVVIAEVNDRMPPTLGGRMVSPEEIDIVVHSSRALPEVGAARDGEVERAIARNVAGLIEDRSTIQLGIGNVPEAIMKALSTHRDLGVHSGTIGDGVADLVEAGVVTNAYKSRDAGHTLTGIVMGSERAYRFAAENPDLRFAPTSYVHAADVLASQDRFVAINSAIEVDLSGQVNAEIAGGVYLGAVGGAPDFLRGAQRSRGGLPIIAMPAGVRGGGSRVVARLSGPVSTARGDAGIIVTEHGVADLRGKTLRERRRLLIDIAPPETRAALDAASPDQP